MPVPSLGNEPSPVRSKTFDRWHQKYGTPPKATNSTNMTSVPGCIPPASNKALPPLVSDDNDNKAEGPSNRPTTTPTARVPGVEEQQQLRPLISMRTGSSTSSLQKVFGSVLERSIHESARCVECRKPFGTNGPELYPAKGSDPASDDAEFLCKPCFTATCKKGDCESCGAPVLGIKGDPYMLVRKLIWHEKCFICDSCGDCAAYLDLAEKPTCEMCFLAEKPALHNPSFVSKATRRKPPPSPSLGTIATPKMTQQKHTPNHLTASMPPPASTSAHKRQGSCSRGSVEAPASVSPTITGPSSRPAFKRKPVSASPVLGSFTTPTLSLFKTRELPPILSEPPRLDGTRFVPPTVIATEVSPSKRRGPSVEDLKSRFDYPASQPSSPGHSRTSSRSIEILDRPTSIIALESKYSSVTTPTRRTFTSTSSAGLPSSRSDYSILSSLSSLESSQSNQSIASTGTFSSIGVGEGALSRDNLLTEAEGDAKEYEPAAIDEDIKLEDLLNELENGAWDLVNPSPAPSPPAPIRYELTDSPPAEEMPAPTASPALQQLPLTASQARMPPPPLPFTGQGNVLAFSGTAVSRPSPPSRVPSKLGGMTRCPGCTMSVGPVERGVVSGPGGVSGVAGGVKWHKACLTCGGGNGKGPQNIIKRGGRGNDDVVGCGRQLDVDAKVDGQGGVWCRDCVSASRRSVRPLTECFTGGSGMGSSITNSSTFASPPSPDKKAYRPSFHARSTSLSSSGARLSHHRTALSVDSSFFDRGFPAMLSPSVSSAAPSPTASTFSLSRSIFEQNSSSPVTSPTKAASSSFTATSPSASTFSRSRSMFERNNISASASSNSHPSPERPSRSQSSLGRSRSVLSSPASALSHLNKPSRPRPLSTSVTGNAAHSSSSATRPLSTFASPHLKQQLDTDEDEILSFASPAAANVRFKPGHTRKGNLKYSGARAVPGWRDGEWAAAEHQSSSRDVIASQDGGSRTPLEKKGSILKRAGVRRL